MVRWFIILLAFAVPLPASAQMVSGAPEMPAAPGIAVRARPQFDPALWLGPDDFPTAALRAEQEGRVRVSLLVGLDGRATDCTLLESSGARLLDEQTCKLLMRRARFTAARKRNRTAAPDRWTGSVDWKVPADWVRPPSQWSCVDCGLPWTAFEDRLAAPEPRGDPESWLQAADYPAELRSMGGSVTVELDVARSGSVRGCKVTAPRGLPEWDRELCRLLRRRARFHPEAEAKGKWVTSGWEHRYAWGPAR